METLGIFNCTLTEGINDAVEDIVEAPSKCVEFVKDDADGVIDMDDYMSLAVLLRGDECEMTNHEESFKGVACAACDLNGEAREECCENDDSRVVNVQDAEAELLASICGSVTLLECDGDKNDETPADDVNTQDKDAAQDEPSSAFPTEAVAAVLLSVGIAVWGAI